MDGERRAGGGGKVEEAIKRYRCTAAAMDVASKLLGALERLTRAEVYDRLSHTAILSGLRREAEHELRLAKVVLKDARRSVEERVMGECAGMEVCAMNPLGDCACELGVDFARGLREFIDRALAEEVISRARDYTEKALKMAVGALANCSCKFEVE